MLGRFRWVGVLAPVRLEHWGIALGFACAFGGCSTEPKKDEPPPRATALPSPVPVSRPEIATPPTGTTDGPAYLRAELLRARNEGRTLLVDVGAPWCEPCRRFHAALESGELDRDLPNVRFVELDVEKHRALVEGIGCRSKLVPLFARVTDDGMCSDQRREGAVKGDRAVRFLLSRVKELVDDSSPTASP
jgi:thiol-disulfide isomerase/thioredoxin